MKITLGVAAAAAAVLSCAAPVQAEDQCQPLKIMASVDMVPLRSGVMMVPVDVAGRQVYFVVATADPVSTISAALAEDLKLPRGHSSVKIVGLSGQVADKWADVPVFGIGNLKAESVELMVQATPPRVPPPPPPGVKVPSGALGIDFLRAYDVDLDYGANKLNLISRDHCEGHVLYWKSERLAKLDVSLDNNGKIHFPMNLDGHSLEAVLNTGVAMSNIRMATAGEVFDLDNDSAGNSRAGRLQNGTLLYAHTFKSMNIEGLVIDNPRLILMPSLAEQEINHMRVMSWGGRLAPGDGPRQPELVLGMAELRHLHVYIDYHDHTVYFTPVTPGGDFPKPAAP